MMDVDELSALLQMQNQSQTLLQQLHTQQQQCRRVLDASVSSLSSSVDSELQMLANSSLTQQTTASHNKQFHAVCRHNSPNRDRNLEDQESTIRVQRIKDALAAGNKHASYRQVSSSADDKPGPRPKFKLAQGIDQSKLLPWSSSDKPEHLSSGRNSGNNSFQKPVENGFLEEVEDFIDDDQQDKANTSVTFQEELEMLGSSGELNLSSTPKKPTQPLAETPKSILKRRKIIDDNVHVDSKFSHTPTSSLTPKHNRGLNYSYHDTQDILAATGSPASYTEAKNGSYIEEYLEDKSPSSKGSQHILAEVSTSESRRQEEKLEAFSRLLEDRLLLDDGNDRQNATVVRDLAKRPQSYTFDPSTGEVNSASKKGSPRQPISKSSRSAASRSPKLTRKPAPGVSGGSDSTKLWKSRGDQPLLGYDWIAGVLDNESSLYSQPDDYYREIGKFRQNHKADCLGDDVIRKNLDLTRPISPEVDDPGHTCIHGFTLNERLFTEPMNPDENGLSACPVCLNKRTEPTSEYPGFVRVSIPRSTLETPYRVKPRRRHSFDDSDSYALSKHCVAGYECTLPTTIPTAKNIDLKGADGIRNKQAMTLEEAQNFAKSHSRSRQLLSKPARPLHSTALSGLSLTSDGSQDPYLNSASLSLIRSDYPRSRTAARQPGTNTKTRSNMSSRNHSTTSKKSSRSLNNTSRSSRKNNSVSFSRDYSDTSRSFNRGQHETSRDRTEALLDTSHALRFDLQDLARRKGNDHHRAPHSTAYPLL